MRQWPKKQGQKDNGLQNRRMRQYNGQKTGTTGQWFTKQKNETIQWPKNRDNSTMVYKIEE